MELADFTSSAPATAAHSPETPEDDLFAFDEVRRTRERRLHSQDAKPSRGRMPSAESTTTLTRAEVFERWSKAASAPTPASTPSQATDRRPAFTPAVLALLTGALLLNAGVVVMSWRSQADMAGLLQTLQRPSFSASNRGSASSQGSASGPETPSSSAPDAPAEPGPSLAAHEPPQGLQASQGTGGFDGRSILDDARTALENGRFESARRSLFALLSVADRLEPALREDVSARASFLIGDAYRLQADELAATLQAKRPGGGMR